MSIKITSDSTCDLSPELIERYSIDILPLYINLGGKTYRDGVDIHLDDIFRHVENGGDISTTSAGNIADYTELFGRFADKYDAVIHLNISSDFSSSYQQAVIAAEEFDNVYVVDSRNLSTGHGHVVLCAAEMAAEGMSAPEIVEKLGDIIPRVDASFILDRLDYMRKGGRCSAVAALGANLLKLKPSIHVVGGKMQVGKKYRGALDKCMVEYIRDKLAEAEAIDAHRVFITYSTLPDELVELAKKTVAECKTFDNVEITRAGCTVGCHCGNNCIGVLFIKK